MASRRLNSWLDSYVKYASVTEAPRKMAFWAGVSAIGGALRRKVWIDMKRFQWFPNFYIVFVAPPGVVSKSTSVDMAMKLLRAVPGVNFGPDVVTWPALVEKFAGANESFLFDGMEIPMSALTLEASEMGSLINLRDPEMINLYITLWDGRATFEKVTKMAGCNTVEGPWINMIACTTPQWLAENMPTVAVGGGFTSRCIFLYADTKEKFVAFPDEFINDHDDKNLKEALLHDLTHIADKLVGPFKITKEARDWYRPVYEHFWKTARSTMTTTMLEGYAARKQTLLFKTAMVVSVSGRDDLQITLEDLQLATVMLEDLEEDMQRVFSNVGRTDVSMQAGKFIAFIKIKGTVSYEEAYRYVHTYFPNVNDFEGIVSGAIRAGYVQMIPAPNGYVLKYNAEVSNAL